jgi:hypothetical protein
MFQAFPCLNHVSEVDKKLCADSKVGLPYCFEHKPQWLSDFATRLSDFAIWRSDSATAACVQNNTVPTNDSATA